MEDLANLVSIEDKTITVNDARLLYKGCIPGWKYFAEQNGLDWVKVRRHGMKASELLATNDAMAIELVRFIYERQSKT